VWVSGGWKLLGIVPFGGLSTRELVSALFKVRDHSIWFDIVTRHVKGRSNEVMIYTLALCSRGRGLKPDSKTLS